jgi:hypothetical protein
VQFCKILGFRKLQPFGGNSRSTGYPLFWNNSNKNALRQTSDVHRQAQDGGMSWLQVNFNLTSYSAQRSYFSILFEVSQQDSSHTSNAKSIYTLGKYLAALSIIRAYQFSINPECPSDIHQYSLMRSYSNAKDHTKQKSHSIPNQPNQGPLLPILQNHL